MNPFLRSTDVIDHEEPVVRDTAHRLAKASVGKGEIARACFQWVRDTIPHTSDHALDPISCSASEVLELGTGFCYAKSHLLAALLRANGIPAGLVYQRLRSDDGSFCLHGLNAVWLSEGAWYRLDARGARAGLRSEFSPPVECLPFAVTEPGETLFAGVWADPADVVVDALRRHRTRAELLAHLPDAQILRGAEAELPA
jgi:transglutaminase-like putative cysteine protease